MSRYPAPTREHHDDFCVAEKWMLVRGSAGKPVRHHRTYELTLGSGSVLRTRISKPIDRSTYGPSMWSHILRDQLSVSADEFWACVDRGVLPARGVVEASAEMLPLHLMNELVTRAGLQPDAAILLTRAEALERLRQYWMDEGSGR
ncbi:cytotoxic translational repressor of toxin-antitoxin stability system [Subtercola boreus]|uniref:Cytotoxic translational repressor of toxin-antitoxin stability system n=1 Tax=Subtercola boreus TaxID=120213 RepID=A0A3E0VBQ3_9MICO|nr:cytotoxic translational repressor of toxin-antitoxin stability system [Subtercola boreus]RFA06973.1 cytotoxic translational repressor of toxin-antitoxin stability system [Subtercola boreus]